MQKKQDGKILLGITAGFLFMMTLFSSTGVVEAKSKIVPIEGVAFNVEASMADNLKTLVGKKINVTLDSGTTFYGTLTKVGTHMIHLEKLDRKDFFDALIRIEQISAIDVMFRNYEQ